MYAASSDPINGALQIISVIFVDGWSVYVHECEENGSFVSGLDVCVCVYVCDTV